MYEDNKFSVPKMQQINAEPSFCQSMSRVHRVLFWLTVVTFSVIALLPVDYFPSRVFNWWDKAQHALGFLVLGILGLMAYAKAHRQVVMALLAYGAAIELAQAAMGWRYGDWQDWLADAIGVGAAYLVWGLRPGGARPGRRSD